MARRQAVPPGLTVAAPSGRYQTLASTDMSAALTAGVATLIRGRYPWLTAAEVTEAIEHGAKAPRSAGTTASVGTAGRGHGALNAASALARAAAIAAAHPRPTTQPAPATPTVTAPAVAPSAAAKPGNAGGTARSILLDLLVVVCVLIAGLICALAVTWIRRRLRSADATRAARSREPGRHSRAMPLAPPPVLLPPGAGGPRNRRRPPSSPAASGRTPAQAPAPRPAARPTDRCRLGSSRRRCSPPPRSPRGSRPGRCRAAVRCTSGTPTPPPARCTPSASYRQHHPRQIAEQN